MTTSRSVSTPSKPALAEPVVIVDAMNDQATKNDLFELRKQLNEDIRGHMGVLYEKVSRDVVLLREQVTSVNKRLTVVESKVDFAIEAVADLKVEATSRRERLVRLENRISALETR